ncbi:MAG: hypothetical protein WCE79_19760, partial [Xanthobacteraceae bacterium]
SPGRRRFAPASTLSRKRERGKGTERAATSPASTCANRSLRLSTRGTLSCPTPSSFAIRSCMRSRAFAWLPQRLLFGDQLLCSCRDLAAPACRQLHGDLIKGLHWRPRFMLSMCFAVIDAQVSLPLAAE